METEGSFLYLQELATGPESKPDESTPHRPPDFRNICFNIILPTTHRSSEWSL
jgi:hypothetical protein